MKDFLQVAPIGLVIWWLAQIVLCLRDYFRRRRELRSMLPSSEEEKKALAVARAALPPKEKQTIRWYAEHPGQALKHGWIFVPVLVFFWPMIALIYTLPKTEVRLSQSLIQRLNSESA